MNISYEVMTAAHYDGVRALWDETTEVSTNSTDDSREGIEKYLLRNPATSYVALCEGRVVGAILAGHDGRRGFIQHLAVLPNFRRQGIAAMLVELSMKALDADGIPKVALLAFTKNDKANAFWDKMGFTVRSDVYYRNKAIREIAYRENPFRHE